MKLPIYNLQFSINHQYNNFQKKKSKFIVKHWSLVIGILLVISHWSLVISAKSAKAQTVSLSIAPPIYEVSVVPGNEVDLRYIVSNDSLDTNISVSLFPFTSNDDMGNVELTKDLSTYDPLNIYSWFKLVKPQSNFLEKIPLRSGEKKEIILKISPPENASLGDFYITVLFSTASENFLIGNTALSNVRIGSNILLTVGDGSQLVKKAEIESFSAPKIVDSFSDLNFNIKIGNTGNTYFKPNGSIAIKPLLGKTQSLKLTPLNILANSSRKIECSQGERIVPCSLRSDFLFGVYRSKLDFKIDNQNSNYSDQIYTIAFPFSTVIALVILYMIKKLLNLRKFKQ